MRKHPTSAVAIALRGAPPKKVPFLDPLTAQVRRVPPLTTASGWWMNMAESAFLAVAIVASTPVVNAVEAHLHCVCTITQFSWHEEATAWPEHMRASTAVCSF